MKVASEAAVVAPRERVYAALADADTLRRAIPGCEELTVTGEAEYFARVKLGLAGIRGRYAGTAVYRDREQPASMTLAFDGKGKTGFVRGTAAIRLSEDDGTTRIACEADVQVGGAIAAVGSRLIAAAARKLTRDFFRQLAAAMGVEVGGAIEPDAGPPEETDVIFDP